MEKDGLEKERLKLGSTCPRRLRVEEVQTTRTFMEKGENAYLSERGEASCSLLRACDNLALGQRTAGRGYIVMKTDLSGTSEVIGADELLTLKPLGERGESSSGRKGVSWFRIRDDPALQRTTVPTGGMENVLTKTSDNRDPRTDVSLLRTRDDPAVHRKTSPKGSIFYDKTKSRVDIPAGVKKNEGENSVQAFPVLVTQLRDQIEMLLPRIRLVNRTTWPRLQQLHIVGYDADLALYILISDDNQLIMWDGNEMINLGIVQLRLGSQLAGDVLRTHSSTIVQFVECTNNDIVFHQTIIEIGAQPTSSVRSFPVPALNTTSHLRIGSDFVWFNLNNHRMYRLRDAFRVFTDIPMVNDVYELPIFYHVHVMSGINTGLGNELGTVVLREGRFEFGRISFNEEMVHFSDWTDGFTGVDIYAVAGGKGFEMESVRGGISKKLFIAGIGPYHCAAVTGLDAGETQVREVLTMCELTADGACGCIHAWKKFTFSF